MTIAERLRKIADEIDGKPLTGIGLIIVGDAPECTLGIAHDIHEPDREMMLIGLSIYQATNMGGLETKQ